MVQLALDEYFARIAYFASDATVAPDVNVTGNVIVAVFDESLHVDELYASWLALDDNEPVTVPEPIET